MAKAIEKMSAAECEKEIARIKAREKEVGAAIAEIEPPPEFKPNPGVPVEAYRNFDPLAGAGPEYRRVALEGTPAELIELGRKYEEAKAEANQLYLRRDRLERRLAAAKDEEARAAAPGELKRLAGEIDERVARAERAIAEAKEALADCVSWLAAVERHQKVIGVRGDVLTVEQFRRLGLVLRHRVVETTEHELEHFRGMIGNTVRRPALFRSRAEAVRAAKRLLPAPNPGLIAKVKRKLTTFTSLNVDANRTLTADERRVEADLDEWHRERLDLIAAGHLDEVDNLEPTKPGSKERFRVAG